jgi:hypothetical protein
MRPKVQRPVIHGELRLKIIDEGAGTSLQINRQPQAGRRQGNVFGRSCEAFAGASLFHYKISS